MRLISERERIQTGWDFQKRGGGGNIKGSYSSLVAHALVCITCEDDVLQAQLHRAWHGAEQVKVGQNVFVVLSAHFGWGNTGAGQRVAQDDAVLSMLNGESKVCRSTALSLLDYQWRIVSVLECELESC